MNRSMATTKFLLSNITCGSCVKVSQMKISDIPGVKMVTIKQNGVEADGELEADRAVSLEEISLALADTHYQVHPARS